MRDEMNGLFTVCLWVTAIQSYCYFLVSRLPPGRVRLISLLPVFYLFTQLPFTFSSVHLRTNSAFFLSWLSNFKLLLFSYDEGPLSLTLHPHLSLPAFISTASFPVKLKNPSPSPPTNKSPLPTTAPLLRFLGFAVKGLLLAFIISLYRYKPSFHPWFVLTLYMGHIYLALDLLLAVSAAMAGAMGGLELEPQFKAPYLATSIQDFWGKRWNLMVTSILRPTVYYPVRARCGSLVAVLAVFLISGLMHEAMFYYLTAAPPTGAVTCFFALHGACTVAEIAVKRRVAGRWRVYPLVSGPLTLGFMLVTAFWLFLPAMLRNGTAEKAIAEYAMAGQFFQELFPQLS